MRAVKLKREHLFDFLGSLSQFGVFWGPVKKGDGHVLAPVDDFSKIDSIALHTRLPFKKLLVPPKFNVFTFKESEIKSELKDIPQRVIFRLHPCDIWGLMIMDKFFTANYIDPYYYERRKRTIMIGISCIPDERCFCKTTNTGNVETGCDLFLSDLGEILLVWVFSSLGDDLVRECPELVDENLNADDLKRYVDWRVYRENQFKLRLDFTGMPGIMELGYDSEFWDELGEKCLSCGACTIVCPTYPCYNVIDNLELNRDESVRTRQWDSCMYREYSMVAGGHNFREAHSERLKLRFTHKLQAFVGQFGEPACVGWGRCIDTCPVGIDIKTVALALKREEVSA
jgi:sulfhydrogenase subunit beta (sulfur reductase)